MDVILAGAEGAFVSLFVDSGAGGTRDADIPLTIIGTASVCF